MEEKKERKIVPNRKKVSFEEMKAIMDRCFEKRKTVSLKQGSTKIVCREGRRGWLVAYFLENVKYSAISYVEEQTVLFTFLRDSQTKFDETREKYEND